MTQGGEPTRDVSCAPEVVARVLREGRQQAEDHLLQLLSDQIRDLAEQNDTAAAAYNQRHSSDTPEEVDPEAPDAELADKAAPPDYVEGYRDALVDVAEFLGSLTTGNAFERLVMQPEATAPDDPHAA